MRRAAFALFAAFAALAPARFVHADDDDASIADGASGDAADAGEDASTLATDATVAQKPPAAPLWQARAPVEDAPVVIATDTNKRGGGEAALFYLTMIEWGGSASFFIEGLTQSGNAYAGVGVGALAGMLLSAPLGAAGAAGIDALLKHERGAAATVTTAMLLGLGEGVAWDEYFSNRASTSFHTYTKDAAWIFGAQGVGLVGGIIVAELVPTTPGRSAWIATTGIFGGLFAGSIAGAASRPSTYPTTPWDAEGNRNVGLASALAGIAGAAGGIATASWLSPSALRVHLVDLGWIGGTVIPALACIGHCTAPDTFLAMAIGGGVGFAGTFVATAWLPKDRRNNRPGGRAKEISFSPYAIPMQNGVQVGIGGSL